MQNPLLLPIKPLENRTDQYTAGRGLSCYFLLLLNLIVIVTNALQQIKIIINQKSLLKEFKEDEKMESSIEKK